MLITAPSAAAGSWRANSCISTKGARRLVSRWRSQVCRVAERARSFSNAAALLTRQPSGPSAATARGTSVATSASRARSAATAAARPPPGGPPRGGARRGGGRGLPPPRGGGGGAPGGGGGGGGGAGRGKRATE